MAEPTAHTEAPGGKPAFPPFQTQTFPSQLVWLAVSFVFLYVLMAKIALPRIGAIFEERSKRISGDLKAAQDFKAQSDEAHTAYEKALADARGRAQSIANDMREKQAAASEAASKKLEAELHEKLVSSEKSIAATRATAMGNVGTIATDTASAIVQRLIGKVPADHEVAAAVGDALKR